MAIGVMGTVAAEGRERVAEMRHGSREGAGRGESGEGGDVRGRGRD